MSSLSATIVQQPDHSRSDEGHLTSVVARMGIARQRTRHSSRKVSLCSVPEDSALTAQNPMFENFTPSVEADTRAQQVLRASLSKGCTNIAKHTKGSRQPCVPNPASAQRAALQKHCRTLLSSILRYCSSWTSAKEYQWPGRKYLPLQAQKRSPSLGVLFRRKEQCEKPRFSVNRSNLAAASTPEMAMESMAPVLESVLGSLTQEYEKRLLAKEHEVKAAQHEVKAAQTALKQAQGDLYEAHKSLAENANRLPVCDAQPGATVET